MDLYDNIKTNYSTYFSKYETSKNQLLSAILYSIHILSNEDVNMMLKQFDYICIARYLVEQCRMLYETL